MESEQSRQCFVHVGHFLVTRASVCSKHFRDVVGQLDMDANLVRLLGTSSRKFKNCPPKSGRGVDPFSFSWLLV